MTNLQKNAIVAHINKVVTPEFSANKLAVKAGVSSGTISKMINGNWNNMSAAIWQKVAKAADYRSDGWQVVETTNYNRLTAVFNDAKFDCEFYAVSHKAGSGKTATINSYTEINQTKHVYKYQCRDLARREFLIDLGKELSIEKVKTNLSVDKIQSMVIDFFKARAHHSPLLIIDEADKLRPSALRFFITLYNEMEDEMGCVICGTENLEKEIKSGVRRNAKGYDELDDRFGRKFIHLIGALKKDVQKVCEANGISDKELQLSIFNDCSPCSIVVQNKSIKVIESMRRLKRVIKRELKKQRLNAI